MSGDLVLSRKKAAVQSGEQDLLGLLYKLSQLIGDDQDAEKQTKVLNQFVRTIVAGSELKRAALFFELEEEKNYNSIEFVCVADSEAVEPAKGKGSEHAVSFKKSARATKKFHAGEVLTIEELAGSLKVKSNKGKWKEVFESGNFLIAPIVEHQHVFGFVFFEFESKKEIREDWQVFGKLLACMLYTRLDSKPSSSSSIFQEWLFNSFSYPVFLIDTKAKRIVKANRIVEQILTGADGQESVSPSNLVTLVENTVEQVSSSNPLVWCRGYLPNLYGDFYVVATSFTVGHPDHVCAALLPANDKQWDFVKVLKKLSSEDLAAEAAVKQLYWDRLIRQVVTRLHSSLDLNIVLQLLVDNLGQCLNASRCLFIKSESTSITVSHEYSEPSISPLGLGRTAKFPEAVVNLFRSGPLALSDVTSLRHSSSISSTDVSSMLNAGINSIAGAPFFCNGVLFGVLIVIEMGDDRDWTSNEMEMIKFCSSHATVAIELCMEHQRVKDQLYHASMQRSAESRDEVARAQSYGQGKEENQTRSRTKTDMPHLSERELEVLRLIASGLSNKEIAGRLFLTASTVELHASRMRKKLKMKSRTQLVKYACDHGLV